LVGETVEDLMKKAVQVKGVRIVRHMQSEDMRHLVSLAKHIISHDRTVAVLGSDQGGAKMVVARSEDVDLDCKALVSEALKIVGGSGGGKADFAQGGGPDAAKIEQALDSAVESAKGALAEE
jgi:alanyl-tRNA synthetase